MTIAPLMAIEPNLEKIFRDYVKALIQREAKTAEDRWENVGSGGYLFYFKYDINNDGNEALFITSSLDCFKSYADWTVFHKNAQGKYIPYKGTIRLPIEGFFLDKKDTSAVFVDSSSRGYTYYGRYQKLAGDTFQSEFKEISEKEYERLNSPESVQQVTPQLEAIHLVDFLHNPKQAWMEVDSKTLKTNGNGFVRIPKDEGRMKKFQMSPKAALQEIEKLKE
jgi:hypothetical protein